jgi:type VI secretion system protein ImpK
MSALSDAPAASQQYRGALALALQEALTATVRLRSNRQAISDETSFRAHIRQALQAAEWEGRKAGYSGEDVRLAIFAVVAFLDESVLNSGNRLLVNWPRKPLQEELFGGHVAGEIFFQNLRHLLGRDASDHLADVLEVYQLCMLLGYRGRYSHAGGGELQAIMAAVADKIRRIRGEFGALSPAGLLPAETRPVTTRDPWIRRLVYAALGCLLLCLVLFAAYRLTLSSGVSEIRSLATRPVR